MARPTKRSRTTTSVSAKAGTRGPSGRTKAASGKSPARKTAKRKVAVKGGAKRKAAAAKPAPAKKAALRASTAAKPQPGNKAKLNSTKTGTKRPGPKPSAKGKLRGGTAAKPGQVKKTAVEKTTGATKPAFRKIATPKVSKRALPGQPVKTKGAKKGPAVKKVPRPVAGKKMATKQAKPPAKAAPPSRVKTAVKKLVRPAPSSTKTSPAKPSGTRTPVHKPPVAPLVPVAATAPTDAVTEAPRPSVMPALKQRFQLEFYLNASLASLFELISTPSGFSEWFCDDVNVSDNLYTFKWGDDSESALCIAQHHGEYMRFRWSEDLEEDPGAFFELRIRVDGMTNETCLVVTDHAWPKDLEEERALWEAQIHTLIRVLGA